MYVCVYMCIYYIYIYIYIRAAVQNGFHGATVASAAVPAGAQRGILKHDYDVYTMYMYVCVYIYIYICIYTNMITI